MLNVVITMGRLTKDPELRVTDSGKSVTSFTVAVDNKFDKEKTDFLDVIAWRQTAEFVCKYFRKGSMIAIQGRLATRTWEDKNGNKRKAVEIIADNVSFCGDKKEATYTAYTPSVDIAPPADDEDFREIPEDDLPF